MADGMCNSTNSTGLFRCEDAEKEVSPESDKTLHTIMKIVAPICLGIITVVGLIGNSLVVIVVLCNSQMRSTTNILIVNLAVADLLFLIFCVPFAASYYALGIWPFKDAVCPIWLYLMHVFATASVYSLLLMSLGRFVAVVRPRTSKSICTKRNTYMSISCMWFVILLSCTPLLWTYGIAPVAMNNNKVLTFCKFLVEDGYNLTAFRINFFIFAYVIPLVLIFSLYFVILLRLWSGVVGEHITCQRERAKRHVTRMVVVVVVVFAICWCPLQIVLLLESLDAYVISFPTAVFHVTSNIMAYMNSCVNPILYAFISKNFRKGFCKAVHCALKPEHLHRTSTDRTPVSVINESILATTADI